MLERNTYSAKTIRCFDRLIELNEEINNDKYLEKNKKLYRRKFKAFNNDWDKHIISKKLENSDINTEVNLIRYEINNKLDNMVNGELIEDAMKLFKSVTYIEEAIVELNKFIDFELPKTIDKLEEIRVKAETNVSMKSIQALKRKYIDKEDIKLMSELCSQNILRARALEAKFNKIIDGMEILEGIDKI